MSSETRKTGCAVSTIERRPCKRATRQVARCGRFDGTTAISCRCCGTVTSQIILPSSALRRQANDVHLTIDAGLQIRVSSIVASYARKSAGRAAAIVLDPDTGELLASASYPWPDVDTPESEADNRRSGVGSASGSRAVRALSTGFHVQAGDGGGRASSRRRSSARPRSRARGCRMAGSAPGSRAGIDRSGMTCSTRTRMGRSICTKASSIPATRTSRNWRSRSARSRSSARQPGLGSR